MGEMEYGKPAAKKVPGCGWWLPAVTTMRGPKPLPNADRCDSASKAKTAAKRILAEVGRSPLTPTQ